MAIVQEQRSVEKDMTGLTFAELAHMPFVNQPNSVDDITEEWFETQKKLIDDRISVYQLNGSMPQTAKRWEIDKLRKLIERLRKFTTEVLTERARREEAQKPATPPAPQTDPCQEYNEAIDRHEAYVEELIRKSNRINSRPSYEV